MLTQAQLDEEFGATWFDTWHSHEEIEHTLQRLVEMTTHTHNEYAVVGQSFEGRNISAFYLGNPEASKEIVMVAGLHAREWISPAANLGAIRELMLRTDLGALANVRVTWMVLTNPDGYEFSRSGDAEVALGHGCWVWSTVPRCWRKNRRPSPAGYRATCIGVDLNRNFPHHFGGAESSNNPCENNYRGTGAASEPETQAVMEVLDAASNRGRLMAGIDFHSYGQMILTQPGWTSRGGLTDTVTSSEFAEMTSVGNSMQQSIRARTGAEYEVKPASKFYAVGGSLDDTIYQEGTIGMGYTIELRDEDRSGSFVLAESHIPPTSQEVTEAVLTMLNHVNARQAGIWTGTS